MSSLRPLVHRKPDGLYVASWVSGASMISLHAVLIPAWLALDLDLSAIMLAPVLHAPAIAYLLSRETMKYYALGAGTMAAAGLVPLQLLHTGRVWWGGQPALPAQPVESWAELVALSGYYPAYLFVVAATGLIALVAAVVLLQAQRTYRQWRQPSPSGTEVGR